MKKEIECKVVEDLLFGYVDKTLNNESKKLVENHLKDCKDCKEKLNEILEENKQNEKIQQREIDYLKKIKIKSRIKSILIAIGIIILILILLYLIKFIRISNIMGKAERSLKSQNYYCEKQENSGEDSVSVSKTYYKDGKYKITNEIYSDNGKELISTEYGEERSDERKIVNEREKIVTVYKGDISETFNKEENVKFDRFPLEERKMVYANLGKAFLMSIESDSYDSNKEYYILRYKFDKRNTWEVWLDKETGLVIREINRGGSIVYIPGTEIVKKESDIIEKYKYDFGIVNDEDVNVPDFSGYKVEYQNWNMSDIGEYIIILHHRKM